MHALLKIFSPLFIGICCFTACQNESESGTQKYKGLSFNYDIKPILSDRCFACHGPDANKREADLRLDTPEGAFAALTENPGHFAIVAGEAEESEVYLRISSTDPETRMPPPESNLKITAEEVELIRQWIEEGAEYEPHWSFIKPEKSEVPEVQNTGWPRNEIDHFVLAKMESQQWQPALQAEKTTLLRRLSFDLTGLPPTVEELEDFLKNESPHAYEQAVDKLLDSERYGERMASEWLDVARYADSHGYQDDGMRNMWPWRDWVIQAFNKNLPYDDFILWQLAGDMLPNPGEEQILATGFNRNHLQSQEGGIVDEEYRVEYVADRTNTLGKAFLGLTLECARCHDHKYDPVSQKEYYEMFAFFNNVNEAGQIPYMGEASPTLILTSEEAEEQLAFIEEKIVDLEKKVAPNHEKHQQAFEQWKNALPEQPNIQLRKAVGHYPLDQPMDNKFRNLANQAKPANMVVNQQDQEPEIVETKFGKGLKLVGDSYVDLGDEIGYFDRHQPFTISIWFKPLKDSLDGPIFSRSGGLFNGNRGYDFMLLPDGSISASLNHTYPANGIEVRTQERILPNQWHHLVFTYDGSSKAKGVKIYQDGKELTLTVFNDQLEQSIIRYGKDRESWGGSGNLQIGKRFEETLDGAVVDEFMVFDKKLSAPEVSKLYDASADLKPFLAENQQEKLLDYYLENFDPDYQKQFRSLTEERGKENDILTDQQEVMVMQDRTYPRQSFILERGAYDAHGEEVSANTPEVIMTMPTDLPKNRLGLAKWLIHEDHPLTARVVVNRYWQMLFGRGLVNTSDDFGSQGELPSHPELLDWLAVNFRESGWDVKALLKMMVMSATYQQSSIPDEEKLEMDPENVWLARGPSYRMPVEMIRDNALAVSGLLADSIGGPSVKPYQPKGLWKELATRNVTEYVEDSGQNLYRRGLYTIWKRSSPPPSMISFDASEKYLCVVKRQKTSTPLQALILLNDPQYIEASRLLAERMMKEGGEATEKQIAYGFEALTSRTPDSRELALLKSLYLEELEVFKSDPVSADSLLQVGEYPRDQQLAKAELAALTVVANTLVNYDEAVFKR
ncbi:DUF1553 domain-containing protein [Catalinimonas niigatensis]|uniref:DUF1553 domain-containing protein n=1 Tax=Catalinimonas niigatensis TaxID=1397264 RepID=UPI0026650E2F|nr:DUF1553 domain-containing protein [Catalinimonas niigatensis]WPP49568.1 DUF1553 domain-containing protein [Catalinimonas niigatensis]